MRIMKVGYTVYCQPEINQDENIDIDGVQCGGSWLCGILYGVKREGSIRLQRRVKVTNLSRRP